MLYHLTVQSNSPVETARLGRTIAAAIAPGTVIALTGSLGTGKTLFAKAFAKTLGVRQSLTSPSFVIASQYRLRNNKIKQFLHLDLYRVQNLSTEDAELLQESVRSPQSVLVVEWADRALALLNKNPLKNFLLIRFSYGNGRTQRIIRISVRSSSLLRKLQSLHKSRPLFVV